MYVNLITKCFASFTGNPSHIDDLHFRPSGKRPHDALNLTSILSVVNKFRPNQHGRYGLILMRQGASLFAVLKPAFRRQKDENQNDDAQYVPLPGVSGVIPKKQFFEQIHQIKLTSGRFGS